MDIQFRQIQQRLEEVGIRPEARTDGLDYPDEAGFDPQFGARLRKRVLQRRIRRELHDEQAVRQVFGQLPAKIPG